jgi:hypothetical protein
MHRHRARPQETEAEKASGCLEALQKKSQDQLEHHFKHRLEKHRAVYTAAAGDVPLESVGKVWAPEHLLYDNGTPMPPLHGGPRACAHCMTTTPQRWTMASVPGVGDVWFCDVCGARRKKHDTCYGGDYGGRSTMAWSTCPLCEGEAVAIAGIAAARVVVVRGPGAGGSLRQRAQRAQYDAASRAVKSHDLRHPSGGGAGPSGSG